jgi:pilus assembly protein Flp/PilA
LLLLGINIANHRRKEIGKPMRRLLYFLKDEGGASAVEYGLLVALIAAVIVGAVTLLGGNLKATFDYIATIVLKP